MGEPAISVVMPVYNGVKYVAEAVRSILGQTRGDFEFLAIDDGSTDGSGEILRRFAAEDGRIKLVSRENRGLTRTLNEAAELARGEFIARMDADDVALPGRLAAQMEYMRAHPECGVVGGAVVCITAEGWEIDAWTPPGGHEAIDAGHIRGVPGGILHPTALLRRSVLKQAGGYRDEWELAEDLDLWLRMAEVARVGNVGEVVLRYRMHAASLSQARRREQWERVWQVVRQARERRGLEALPARKWPGGGGEKEVAERARRTWAVRAIVAGNYRTARRLAWQNLGATGVSRRSLGLVAGCALGPVTRRILRRRVKSEGRDGAGG